jgi:acetolactate synthase small subunit
MYSRWYQAGPESEILSLNSMKKEFTLEVYAENGFSVLNRLINIFNRRRIRIKSIFAAEMEENYKNGIARFVLHTTEEKLELARPQLEKLIEVERTVLLENEPANKL